MKKHGFLLLLSLFSLVVPTLFAQHGQDVSDDDDTEFIFTIEGTNKPARLPSMFLPSNRRFGQATYRVTYLPTGDELVAFVFLEENYVNNGDGTFYKTVTRRVDFSVDRFTDYNVTFEMNDTYLVDIDDIPRSPIVRSFDVFKQRIHGGSTLNTSFSGDRDVQDSPFLLIGAYEIKDVLDYAYGPEVITVAREQAARMVVQYRGQCSGEVSYFFLKFLDYVDCDNQSACIQDMLNMERVVVPNSCSY